jgi:hypothetical protein
MNGIEHQTVATFGGGTAAHTFKRRQVIIQTQLKNKKILLCLEIPKICDLFPVVSLWRWRETMRQRQLNLAPVKQDLVNGGMDASIR